MGDLRVVWMVWRRRTSSLGQGGERKWREEGGGEGRRREVKGGPGEARRGEHSSNLTI